MSVLRLASQYAQRGNKTCRVAAYLNRALEPIGGKERPPLAQFFVQRRKHETKISKKTIRPDTLQKGD